MLVKYCFQQVKALPFHQSQSSTIHEKKIVPVNSSEFRYLRFRAIGNLEVSGPNGNYDAFPYQYFEDERPGFGYKSFINKRAHIEHNSSEGNAGSIGDLPDAYLNKFIYPESKISSIVASKGKGKGTFKWEDLLDSKYSSLRQDILSLPNQTLGDIEVLMRIDTKLVDSAKTSSKVKSLLSRLVRMIDTGQTLTCSMGCNCTSSRCSICGNEAIFATDYCDHLKNRKGAIVIASANQLRDLLISDILRPEWLKHIVASKYDVQEVLNGVSNKGIACRCSEINQGLSFFELSIVGIPAFSEAKMLEKLGSKIGGDREEYLRKLRQVVGDENLLDLYSIIQRENSI